MCYRVFEKNKTPQYWGLDLGKLKNFLNLFKYPQKADCADAQSAFFTEILRGHRVAYIGLYEQVIVLACFILIIQ